MINKSINWIYERDIGELTLLALFSIILVSLLIYYLGIGTTVYGILILDVLLISGILAVRHPWLLPLGYLVSSIIYLNNYPGTTTPEILFFLFSAFLLLIFFLPYLSSFSLPIYSKIDKLALILIILLGYGVAMGYINGASPVNIFGDLTYYAGFVMYFVLLKYYPNKFYRRAILYIFAATVIYILIRNAINYQQIIVEAYATWQVGKARVATNEVYILAGSTFFLSSYLYAKKLLIKLFYLALVLGGITGIIITQSRGYWIALAFSFFITFLMVDSTKKKEILLVLLSFAGVSTIIIYLYFSDLFMIVYNALIDRLQTIIYLYRDLGVSLQERLLETQTILYKLLQNPIAGYGFGVTYPRYLIMDHIYKYTGYIHNGYLAMWFKLGIIGLGTILAFCWYLLLYNKKIYDAMEGWIQIVALSIFSTVCGMLLVNITSPQFFNFGSMLLLALMGTFTSYYYSDLNNSRTERSNVTD